MNTWPPTPMTPISMDEIRCTLRDVSLAQIMALAHDDGAGCLVWDGYALQGMPQIRIDYRAWPVRRLIWELVHGPIKRGHQIGVSCPDPMCIHPDHLVSRTKSQIQRGRIMPMSTRTRIALTKRSRSSLTPELVREIRASDLPSIEIDRQIGMSDGYASRIRSGIVWADLSSPFAGLGAR